MKRVLVTLAVVLALGSGCASSQSTPKPAPKPQPEPLVDRLLRQINDMPMVDSHTHVPLPAGMAETLKDPDEDIRFRVARLLGSLGMDAKAAIPALEEAKGDKVASVREAVLEALERIQKK